VGACGSKVDKQLWVGQLHGEQGTIVDVQGANVDIQGVNVGE